MCQRMPPYGVVSQIAAHCLADPPRPRSGPGSTGPARTPRGAARSMSSSPQAAGTSLSPHEAGVSRAPPCTALPRSQGGKEEQMRRTNQKGSGARPAGAAPQRTARRWPTARATALKRSIASTPHAPTRRGAPRAPWARARLCKESQNFGARRTGGRRPHGRSMATSCNAQAGGSPPKGHISALGSPGARGRAAGANKGRPPIFKCAQQPNLGLRGAARGVARCTAVAPTAAPRSAAPAALRRPPPPSRLARAPRCGQHRGARALVVTARCSSSHFVTRRCAGAAAAQAAQTAPVRARRVRISPRFPLAAAGCRRPRCSRACGRRGLALCALAPLCVFVRALPRRPRCGRPAAAGRSWGVRVGLLGRRDPRRG